MLLPRFLTALVGIPLLLTAIWWGQFPFALLTFGIILLALLEYFTLAQESIWPVYKKVGLICGAVLSFSFLLFGTRMGAEKIAGSEIFFSPAAVFAILILLVLIALFSKDKENAFLSIAITWVGICYIAWSLSHLFLIRDLRPDGMFYTFFLFLVIWALDIGSYFGGLKFGRRKLAEYVSPKKTWEGCVIGSLAALFVALLCQQISERVFLRPFKLSHALWLGILIIVLAQISDLSESLFKRNAQVKDSGSLIPGHGGILDRFDSFLLTSPVYYYALVFFVAK